MSQHAVFSPSSAHRCVHCPGSIVMERGEKDSGSSFADEGTAAHTIIEWSLNNDVKPDHYKGELMRVVNGVTRTPDMMVDFFSQGGVIERDTSWEVDDDMLGHLNVFTDIVDQLCEIEGAKLFVEERVSTSHVLKIKDQFGTVDALIVAPGELIVVDYKHGRGVEVSAEENEQLMMYALGALVLGVLIFLGWLWRDRRS